jgi:Fuc2NAc and GlcNAc transferase
MLSSQHVFDVLIFVVAAIYIIGTANIYNFMDGINGIAAITGIVGFGLLAFFAFNISGDRAVGVLSLGIVCACLGFLPFNFPKAKIFMGDVGSIVLGFTFSGLVLWLSRTAADLICLSAFIFPFYADEATTMCIRIKNRENLLMPHRSHLYQILANELKFPHWKVTLGYGFIQFLIGISILFVRKYGSMAIVSTLLVYFGIFVIFSFKVRQRAKLQIQNA